MPPMPPPMPPHPGPRPRPFPTQVIYLRPVQSCRSVYNNQGVIDGLNAILAGCDKLKVSGHLTCDRNFINRIEQRLLRELSIAQYVGTNCNQPTLY